MMTSDGGMTHFGAVDETTKRLVARCAKVKWLKEDIESSNGSPVVAKKLLEIEMPSAMTSSVSVVEVAAHKEKPGVQTPSRRDEFRKEEREALIPPTGGSANGAGKSPFEVEGEA